MAWLKLMKHDGSRILVNTDEVSEVHRVKDSSGNGFGAAIWSHGEATGVDESAEEIAAMIEQAERRELVRRFALAIVSTEYPRNQAVAAIWKFASDLADAEPQGG